MSSIDTVLTYHNTNGLPIIRRCRNCKFWKPEIKSEYSNLNIGYCKLYEFLFAFTLEPTVFAITKDFYLCAEHKFDNEEHLATVSKSVLLKDAIKPKEKIK
jgi:hypothetical protein